MFCARNDRGSNRQMQGDDERSHGCLHDGLQADESLRSV